VLDRKFQRLTLHSIDEGLPKNGRIALVVYDAPMAAGNEGPDLRKAKSVAGLARQDDSPRNFIVFMN